MNVSVKIKLSPTIVKQSKSTLRLYVPSSETAIQSYPLCNHIELKYNEYTLIARTDQ